MMGPQCPACGAKVKLPKNAPLPPPNAKVKCPGCGGVGELEDFLRAAGAATDEEPVGAAVPVGAAAASAGAGARPRGTDSGTRISGSATKLNLPPGLRCTLTVISGPDSGRKMTIDRARVVVGRNAGDFPLTDEEVSSQHCAFEISGITCTVRDLGSSNGTWVDGEKVAHAAVGPVGEVVVGGSTLLFTMTVDEGLPGA